MTGPMFEPKYESMARNELSDLQLSRLRWSVAQAAKVPAHKSRMDEAGVSADDIKTLDDVRKLPFTTKHIFAPNYPFGLVAAPMEDVVRIHASSGTTGKPKIVAYTQNDLANWANICARCLTAVGVTPKDIFHNAVGYGMFTGGLGMHYGAERLGAVVIPGGTGQTQKQIAQMQDFGVTAIHATPSYALYLAETARKMDIEPSSLPLKIGCFGAEPWAESTRKPLEESLGIKAFNSYGLSEMYGPGVAFECVHQDGIHIWEDHFLVEIVDKNGDPAEDEEWGELVLTSLTKEALPIFRYKTGDITRIIGHSCECGRTTAKLDRFSGRMDDMLIIRGINVYPSQIEEVVMKSQELGEHFQIVVTRAGNLDEINVQVELAEGAGDAAAASGKLAAELKSVLNIRANVEILPEGTIPRVLGKAKKVIDNREQ